MKLKQYNISVIGLGYVWLPLAVEFGKLYKVLGFDLKKSRINELKDKVDNLTEISKKELEKAKYLSFSAKQVDLEKSNIYIITVPTPVDKNNVPIYPLCGQLLK